MPPSDLAAAQQHLKQALEQVTSSAAAGEPELDPEAREGDIGEVYGTQRARRRRAAEVGEPELAGGGRLHRLQPGRHRASLLRARPARRIGQGPS